MTNKTNTNTNTNKLTKKEINGLNKQTNKQFKEDLYSLTKLTKNCKQGEIFSSYIDDNCKAKGYNFKSNGVTIKFFLDNTAPEKLLLKDGTKRQFFTLNMVLKAIDNYMTNKA
jgi:hypothetical protein